MPCKTKPTQTHPWVYNFDLLLMLRPLRHNLDLWVCRRPSIRWVKTLQVQTFKFHAPLVTNWIWKCSNSLFLSLPLFLLSTTNNWPIPANRKTTNRPQQCRNVDEGVNHRLGFGYLFSFFYSSFLYILLRVIVIYITQPCWRQYGRRGQQGSRRVCISRPRYVSLLFSIY